MKIIDEAVAFGAKLEGEAKAAFQVVLSHLHNDRDRTIAAIESKIATLATEHPDLAELWSKLKLHL